MKPFLLIILTTLVLSCNKTPKLDYKYGDKEQLIICANQNNALLNEALYSFEEDILKSNPSPTKTLNAAYAQYIYKGMLGTMPYTKIANEHSLAIRDQLITEGIINTTGAKSNLNYEHPAVQCIINKIETEDIKRTINALLEVNGMDPGLFSSRLRNFGREAAKSRYEATFIALDSYYQNLVGISLDSE